LQKLKKCGDCYANFSILLYFTTTKFRWKVGIKETELKSIVAGLNVKLSGRIFFRLLEKQKFEANGGDLPCIVL